MIFPEGIPVYGNKDHRDKKCPLEGIEQATFFNKLRREFPNSYGLTACHIKNEGKKTRQQAEKDAAQGLTAGACDIIIPGGPAFICELKRQDHTQSALQPKQPDYLSQAKESGAFVCIALGWAAAWEAFQEWRNLVESR